MGLETESLTTETENDQDKLKSSGASSSGAFTKTLSDTKGLTNSANTSGSTSQSAFFGGSGGTPTVSDYVVKGKDADKRKDTPPYAVDSGTVAQGSVVEMVEKSADQKFAKVKVDDGSTTWLDLSDLEPVTKVEDNTVYTAEYNDVFVYKDPVGQIVTKKIQGKDTKFQEYSRKQKTSGNAASDETLAEDSKVKIFD